MRTRGAAGQQLTELQSENSLLRQRLQSTLGELRAVRQRRDPSPEIVDIECLTPPSSSSGSATPRYHVASTGSTPRGSATRGSPGQNKGLTAAATATATSGISSSPFVSSPSYFTPLQLLLQQRRTALGDEGAPLEKREQEEEEEERGAKTRTSIDRPDEGEETSPPQRAAPSASQRQDNSIMMRLEALFAASGRGSFSWPALESALLCPIPSSTESPAQPAAAAAAESELVEWLERELHQSRADLRVAHQRVEELSAVVLSYEHTQTVGDPSGAPSLSDYHKKMLAASHSSQQAATEIAFLCDTLTAVSAERDMLEKKVESLSLDRDSALAAFEDLRRRSEEMLLGCEAISSSSTLEAQAAVSAVTFKLRQREQDLSLLRGQLLTLNRRLDEQGELKGTLEKELVESKTRVHNLQELLMAARSEQKKAKQECATARTQVETQRKRVAEAEERARRADMDRATMSARLAEVKASHSGGGRAPVGAQSAPPASDHHLSAEKRKTTESPAKTRTASSSSRAKPPLKKKTSSTASAKATSTGERNEDVNKQADLAAFLEKFTVGNDDADADCDDDAPNAVESGDWWVDLFPHASFTSAEASRYVRRALHALQAQFARFEEADKLHRTQLRKLQSVKTDGLQLKEMCSQLETQLHSQNRTIAEKCKQLDKLKRENDAHKSTRASDREQLTTLQRAWEEERSQLQFELQRVVAELEDGKQLILNSMLEESDQEELV